MQEPADVTQTFSSERTPTVWRIIPTLEYLIKRWDTMSKHPRYSEISLALIEGIESLRKWFHRADTTSNAYFICLGIISFLLSFYVYASRSCSLGSQRQGSLFPCTLGRRAVQEGHDGTGRNGM